MEKDRYILRCKVKLDLRTLCASLKETVDRLCQREQFLPRYQLHVYTLCIS